MDIRYESLDAKGERYASFGVGSRAPYRLFEGIGHVDTRAEKRTPRWVRSMRESGYVVSDVSRDELPPPVSYPAPEPGGPFRMLRTGFRRILRHRGHAPREADAALP